VFELTNKILPQFLSLQDLQLSLSSNFVQFISPDLPGPSSIKKIICYPGLLGLLQFRPQLQAPNQKYLKTQLRGVVVHGKGKSI
jgi:hypothetical protein